MATANSINMDPGASGNIIISQGASSPLSNTSASTASGCVLLNTYTASSSASIEITSQISSTYYAYTIVGTNIVPATNTVGLNLHFSTNNGSTWDTSAGSYAWTAPAQLVSGAGTLTSNSSSSDTRIRLMGNIDNTKNASFTLDLIDPSVAGVKCFYKSAAYSGGNLSQIAGTGVYTPASGINAVRLIFNIGNISTGTFKLYGWLA